MNGRYETDDLDEPAPAPADREISLGTGAMLGIFLALVLVCGAFFGFGYSMGHKAVPLVASGAAAASTAADPDVAAPVNGGVKTGPAGGASDAPAVVVKPSASTAGPRTPASAMAANRAATVSDTGERSAATETRPVAAAAASAGAKPAHAVPATAAPAIATPAEPGAAATPAAGAGGFFVQISAVSHPEDAQLLLTALKRRGYEPTVRHTPQDQLLHVQLGPFATKKDADAMRQRLSADGYNAILK